MKCNRHMGVKDQFGNTSERPCNRKPAFKVSYISPVGTNIITENICKMHFNATLHMLTKLSLAFLCVEDITFPKHKG